MVQYLDKNSGFAQWNANKNNTQKKSGLGGFMWWFLIFVAAWWTVGLFIAGILAVKIWLELFKMV